MNNTDRIPDIFYFAHAYCWVTYTHNFYDRFVSMHNSNYLLRKILEVQKIAIDRLLIFRRRSLEGLLAILTYGN